jgi:Stage II sporulation protein E (SpoIIE)
MNPVTPRSASLRPFAALALGLLALAGGVALARAWLPVWLAGSLPDEPFFTERYRELADRAGLRLAAGEPRVSLVGRDENLGPNDAVSDRLSPEQAAAAGEGLLVRVAQSAFRPAAQDRKKEFAVRFLPSGAPVVMGWGGIKEIVTDTIRQHRPPASAAEQARFTRLLIRPGERLEPGGKVALPNNVGDSYPLAGSDPPQHLFVAAPPGGSLVAGRKPGSPGWKGAGNDDVARVLLLGLPLVAGFLTVIVLFVVLIGRRRIGFVNAAVLGAVVFAAAAMPSFAANPGWQGALEVLGTAFFACWAFLMWSTGESYLRSVQPDLTVGLDALRLGRLGPRGARSLLYGIALGALLAGFRLGVLALASHIPGLWPEGASLRLPLFGNQTPFNDGVVLASGVALAMGLASRFLPARWAPWAAALAGGLALPFASLQPAWLQAAVSCAAVGLLVLLCRRAGLAACLAAALSAFLLQAAAFSAMHLAWFPFSFAVAAGTPALFLALGIVGLRRPPQAELERIKPPAFMKRIAEERRLRYEMDLLRRMQKELLPEKAPEIEGWEIAKRSVPAAEVGGDLYDFLEDEEGRLWIAAGDVAGHDYSCSIAQAMTAASLASLVNAGQTPSGVLQQIDRVLRRNSAHRNFTTLVLLRLDPRTGEGRLANAGHPSPLLAAGGEISEITLAGLPLGQGPPRSYGEIPVRIAAGGVLVFCSDGLFEAVDRQGDVYGYDRPKEVLRALGGRSAVEILDALLADWRRHLGEEEHQDDTTVVVVKRV